MQNRIKGARAALYKIANRLGNPRSFSLPENYIIVFNKRSASFKKARKKLGYGSMHLPIQKFSESWLKENSPAGIIAMGGDGTVHSIANAVLQSGMDIPLGIIPGGGGNDAFERWMTGDTGIAQKRVFEVEYPDANKIYAINNIEWGIGTLVAQRRENNEGNFLIGKLKYFYLVMKSLSSYNHWKGTIRLDGKDLEFDDLSAVIVGFGSSMMGGGYRLFPGEYNGPDKDEKFVMIAEGFSRFKGLGLILKFIREKQYEDPRVKYYPFETLELIPHTSEPFRLTIDGELSPSPPVRIMLSSRRLRAFLN